MTHSRNEILQHTRQVMVELFEVDESLLGESARLYDDLDIDSIDTIDLMIELKRYVNTDIDAQQFKDARTLGDIVDIIDKLA